MNRVGRQWRARWIWGGEDDCPRNEWRCFKRTFELREGSTFAWRRPSWCIIEESGTRIFDLEVRAPKEIENEPVAPEGFTPPMRKLDV